MDAIQCRADCRCLGRSLICALIRSQYMYVHKTNLLADALFIKGVILSTNSG